MRKVILFMLISLDGFFEGSSHAIDWHNVDDEFNQYSLAQLDSAGMLLFGRLTYELMADYWPSPAAAGEDPVTAEYMNRLPKVVFSWTLTEVTWQNSQLVKGDAVEEVLKLKREAGKDLFIFGSSDLAVTLLQHALIDEIRVILNPVILGEGKTLFNGIQERLHLRFLKMQTFRNGNVLLCYKPELKTSH